MATALRKQMIEEMQVRGLDDTTITAYLRSMERFADFHKNYPDQLDIQDIKKYQLHLLREKKLSPNSVNRHLSAIRFFYRSVLERHWYLDQLPRVKAPRKLPIILTEDEVGRMIKSVDNLLYKAIIILMYSSALRHSELRNLKTQDIDGDQMLIHVHDGKDHKDRKALLTPVALKYLRNYWRIYRLRKVKSDWLFVSTKNSYSGNSGLSHTAIGYMFRVAAKAAGIKKKYIPTFFVTPMAPIY